MNYSGNTEAECCVCDQCRRVLVGEYGLWSRRIDTYDPDEGGFLSIRDRSGGTWLRLGEGPATHLHCAFPRSSICEGYMQQPADDGIAYNSNGPFPGSLRSNDRNLAIHIFYTFCSWAYRSISVKAGVHR
jgi:hypothetical protein